MPITDGRVSAFENHLVDDPVRADYRFRKASKSINAFMVHYAPETGQRRTRARHRDELSVWRGDLMRQCHSVRSISTQHC